MRPLLAAAIVAALIGGVSLYMNARETAGPAREFVLASAGGGFELEVTPSFAVEPDPFALTSGAGGAVPSALRVQVNGREVLNRTGRMEAGQAVRVAPVAGLVVGENEFFLEANPPLDQAGRAHAVRVRVLRDGAEVADRSFWSGAGGRIAVTFRLSVDATPARKTKEPHDH